MKSGHLIFTCFNNDVHIFAGEPLTCNFRNFAFGGFLLLVVVCVCVHKYILSVYFIVDDVCRSEAIFDGEIDKWHGE